MRIPVPLLAPCLCAVLPAQMASFPGPARLHAPGGRHVLVCAGQPGAEDYRLILVDRQTRRRVEIYAFDRSLDARWSPDGQTLALTDQPGSAYATTVLVSVRTPDRRLDLDPCILKAYPEDEWSFHRYVVARRWLSPDLLEVVAEGHADRRGRNPEFRMVYHVTLQGDVSRISRLRRLPGKRTFTRFTGPCPR